MSTPDERRVAQLDQDQAGRPDEGSGTTDQGTPRSYDQIDMMVYLAERKVNVESRLLQVKIDMWEPRPCPPDFHRHRPYVRPIR
jgi:hypothetical protein